MTGLGEPLLSVADVADHVGKHPKTVHRWIKSGRLRASRAGGQWLVHPDDLERFLDPESDTDWLAPASSVKSAP